MCCHSWLRAIDVILLPIILLAPDRIEKRHEALADHRHLILNVIYHRERAQAFKMVAVGRKHRQTNNCLQTTILGLEQLDHRTEKQE